MDPYVVEFLRGNLSYEIDMKIAEHSGRYGDQVDSAVRNGNMEDARYYMGIKDGLMLAISVLETVRKGDEDGT